MSAVTQPRPDGEVPAPIRREHRSSHTAWDKTWPVKWPEVGQLLGMAAFYVALVLGAQYYRFISGWIMSMGIIYIIRFLGGKWRDMRVIDTTATEELLPEMEEPLSIPAADDDSPELLPASNSA